MSQLVISHGGCRDGFCAAWVAYNHGYRDAQFHFALHGTYPPWEWIDGRDVLMLDFTYRTREAMDRIAGRAKSLLVLDHHRTAEAVLREAPYAVFDMERSGAGLAWDYLAPYVDVTCRACKWKQRMTRSEHDNFTSSMKGSPCPLCEKQAEGVVIGKRPWLVDYVEDRDLWRWALPNSSSVNAYIGILPFEFERWDKHSYFSFEKISDLGDVALAKVAQYCAEVGKHAKQTTFCGHTALVVNAPYCDVSELLHELLQREAMTPFCTKCRGSRIVPRYGEHPGIGDCEVCGSQFINDELRKPEIAIAWFERGDGTFSYSLRSTTVDVGEIAQRHGGGGHRNAAGFQASGRVLDEVSCYWTIDGTPHEVKCCKAPVKVP